MQNLSKYLLTILVTFALTACSTQPMDAKSVFKPLIYKQCQDELRDSKIWKVATVLMSEQRQTNLQNQTCSCVSENALNDISPMELTKAVVDEELKNSLVKRALVSSVKACLIQNKQ